MANELSVLASTVIVLTTLWEFARPRFCRRPWVTHWAMGGVLYAALLHLAFWVTGHTVAPSDPSAVALRGSLAVLGMARWGRATLVLDYATRWLG
jgi:hypothetical protein